MEQDNLEHTEIRIKGVAVSQGIAIGPAFVLGADHSEIIVRSVTEEEAEAEIARLHSAIDKAKKELALIGEETRRVLGEMNAAIFDVHQLLLEDPELIGETVRRIRTLKQNAEVLFLQVMEEHEQAFSHLDDEYLRARVADLRDIKRRVIRHLLGTQHVASNYLTRPGVVIATDLMPSDTMHQRREFVLGFATEMGSRTSHAAIMARSLKVPSVVGLGDVCRLLNSGDPIILDGISGLVIIHPTPETLQRYQHLQRRFLEYGQKLEHCRRLPSRTKDGKDIDLAANIEFYEEVQPALKDGAMGIGLYRTEYLYLMRDDLPSEEDQFNEYLRFMRAVGDQTIIFRTFDLGGDKAQRHFHVHQEANPFLGFRGVRLYQEREDVFRTQLRAILRASAFGRARIMIPMVACVSEMHYCRSVIEDVKAELAEAKIAFAADIPLGAMIEVPSAAVTADLIARDCDFLSIGTNDLVQYTLAVDRGNKFVDQLYRVFNPGVLRLIKETIRQGHEQGVWVGMCGEMASDPMATMALIGMGLDEFSVSPVSLMVIKEIIRRVNYDECENLAERVLSYTSPDEVEAYLGSVFRRKFKDLLFYEINGQKENLS